MRLRLWDMFGPVSQRNGVHLAICQQSEAIFVPPTLFCPRHDNGLWVSRVASISHVLPRPFCACAVFALSDVFVQNMFQFPDVWQDKRLSQVTCGQIKDNSEQKFCWWSKSSMGEKGGWKTTRVFKIYMYLEVSQGPKVCALRGIFRVG